MIVLSNYSNLSVIITLYEAFFGVVSEKFMEQALKKMFDDFILFYFALNILFLLYVFQFNNTKLHIEFTKQ